MNRATVILFVFALVAIGGGAAWYLTDSRHDSLERLEPVATTTPEVSEGMAIYTNGIYGFSLFYPEQAEVSYTFDVSYHLGSSWRANALPDVPGTPIVAIIPYRTASEDSYPRYFNALVRIGASQDERELDRCETADTSSGETALSDKEIAGRAWKAFSFESAGMMQYVRGVSYRTIFEGRCIALEQIRTGSIYREAPSERDIPDAVLDAEYEKLTAIVASFTFAR